MHLPYCCSPFICQIEICFSPCNYKQLSLDLNSFLESFNLHLGNNYFSSKRHTKIIDHYFNSLKKKFNPEFSGVILLGEGGEGITLTLPAGFD
jgi:hypothetical protein